MGLWDRQDTGTSAKGGSPLDVLRTPGGDCGTDRTVVSRLTQNEVGSTG